MQNTASEYMKQIRPVYILGPTARNGVTMLQRLFNSSGQIMVYGENTALTEIIPNLVHGMYATHTTIHPEAEAARERFAQGDQAFWSSSLMPDTQAMATMTFDFYARMMRMVEHSAGQYDRPRWGFKTPIASPQVWQRLMSLAPLGRAIFIYRSPFDVAASAKARKFVQTDADLIQLAEQWATNVTAVLSTPADHTLPLHYESFVVDPAPWLPKLEAFTDITGLDRSVLDTKVNTFKGSADRGFSATSYIPPVDLTDHEIALVAERTAAARKLAGYESP